MNLDGLKTYIVAAIGIALAITVNVAGVAIPGVPADAAWLQHQVVPLLLAITGRSALKKL